MDGITLAHLNRELLKCVKCQRLVVFREEISQKYSSVSGEKFWAKPVPGYGDIGGRLMVLGLAPAARGGNRTGRVFTGDKSAQFLVSCLHKAGFANQPTSTAVNDGLLYLDTYVTAAVKCVPPENKPDRDEMINCLYYLNAELKLMKNLKVILVLGKVAFDSLKMAMSGMGLDVRSLRFQHGSAAEVGRWKIFCSFHPSPRNVNTGKLNEEQFMEILTRIRSELHRDALQL
ncbi:MAG: uracil-DNA glycosylase [Thermoplasmataceae archaeon]